MKHIQLKPAVTVVLLIKIISTKKECIIVLHVIILLIEITMGQLIYVFGLLEISE
jgi:hypothetical protein